MSEANGTPPPPKPAEDGERPTHINIKVKDDKENEVFFKIKFTTPLSKVINAYCERVGAATNTLRFFFDNTRINETDTPGGLEMEDGDMIDVHAEQQGGNGSASGSPGPQTAEEFKPVYLNVTVKDQGNNEVAFRVKETTILEKVFSAYCKTTEIERSSVRFLHDGQRLTGDETPGSREMSEGEIIQAMTAQLGGSL